MSTKDNGGVASDIRTSDDKIPCFNFACRATAQNEHGFQTPVLLEHAIYLLLLDYSGRTKASKNIWIRSLFDLDSFD